MGSSLVTAQTTDSDITHCAPPHSRPSGRTPLRRYRYAYAATCTRKSTSTRTLTDSVMLHRTSPLTVPVPPEMLLGVG
eukprot:scaffold92085_cov37-Prasinocladus_malaysianus.AAC.1